LGRTQVGRDINRHYYSRDEVLEAIETPVVSRLLELIQLRNAHPAFNGQFSHTAPAEHLMVMTWTEGQNFARLEVDLKAKAGIITYSSDDGEQQFFCTEADAMTAD
jgi:sucrose phosphorylase